MNRFAPGPALVFLFAAQAGFAQTAFTYQGQLKQNGQPFTGTVNMDFLLYDALTGTGFIANQTINNVAVSGGLFTVQLGAGEYWNGLFGIAPIYLEIAVNGQTLAPRQAITPTPWAIHAEALTIPFDSTNNPYSPSSPAFRIYNQGAGGAIWGETNAPDSGAVFGWNTATSGNSSGVVGRATSPAGIGIHGLVTTGQGVAVYGRAEATTNGGAGVFGRSYSATSPAGVFENLGGGVSLRVNGLTQTSSLDILGGADLSENFDIVGGQATPGMIVAIDSANPGKLTISTHAYDKRVAGVISGAGGVKPGMKMGQKDSVANGAHPVALSGRVYCYVDAMQHAVEPGDMLTTSNTPGHAMSVIDSARAIGATIGKAMTPLARGRTGLVLVLVNLQ